LKYNIIQESKKETKPIKMKEKNVNKYLLKNKKKVSNFSEMKQRQTGQKISNSKDWCVPKKEKISKIF
jgi:hypothetical protein